MKIFDVEQNTPEWLACRLGLPTASEFDKIITPGGKPSAQAEKYANKILAEIMTGAPVNDFEGNKYTERGKELEPDAVAFYEFHSGIETVRVGFATDDAGTYGCSPDRLVGDDGLLEIKCPAAHTHIQYLLNNKIDMDYWPQVQGQMLVTGREWCDWMSYHPVLPPVVIRIERDLNYLVAMERELSRFNALLAEKKEIMRARGYLSA